MRSYDFYPINSSFYRTKERLRKNPTFSPFIALIPFTCILTFTSYILSGLNHRAGNPSHPIDYLAAEIEDLPLWFSVTPINDEVVVTSSNGKVFKWPQKLNDIKILSRFVEEIKSISRQEIANAALVNKSSSKHDTVLLSVDRNLTYAHLRPIIFALAEAGISNYALETKITDVGAM